MKLFVTSIILILFLLNCNSAKNNPHKINKFISKPVNENGNKQVKPMDKDSCIHIYIPKIKLSEGGDYFEKIKHTKELCDSGHGSCCYAMAEFQYYDAAMKRAVGLAIEISIKAKILKHYMCEIRRSKYFRKAVELNNVVAKYVEDKCIDKIVSNNFAKSLEKHCQNGYLYACQYWVHMTLDKQAEDLKNIENICYKLGIPICVLFKEEIEKNVNKHKYTQNDKVFIYTKMLFADIPLYNESIFDDAITGKLLESLIIKSAAEKFGIIITHGESTKIKYLKLVISDAIYGGTVPGRYLMRDKIWSKEEKEILQNYSDNMRKTNFIDIFSAAGLLK